MWMQKYKKISRFLTFKRFLYQTEEYFYYYFEKTNRNYTNILFFFPTKQKQVSILFLSLPSNLIEVILNKFMSYLITPEGYKPLLDLKQTELGIKQIKEFFQLNLSSELRLRRVTAPLFVLKGMGINDDLNGVERAVTFPIKDLGDAKAEVVHSLAKWKRLTLAEYHIEPGYGIYTDMNAIRADEELGNLHSLYVDQWDWERVITAEDRNVEFLKEIVPVSMQLWCAQNIWYMRCIRKSSLACPRNFTLSMPKNCANCIRTWNPNAANMPFARNTVQCSSSVSDAS